MVPRNRIPLIRLPGLLVFCLWLSIIATTFAEGETDDDVSAPDSKPPTSPKEPQEVSNSGTYGNPLTNVAYITAIVASCVIGIVGLIAAVVCWYRANAARGLAKRTEYPAYGVTGPNPLHNQSFEPPIDKNLNKNAQLFQYQQAKKKIKSLSSAASESSTTSPELLDVAGEVEVGDEETSDGEYTVYECSGFASTVDGPMEIHNPLFDDAPLTSAPSSGFSYSISVPSSISNSNCNSNRSSSNSPQ